MSLDYTIVHRNSKDYIRVNDLDVKFINKNLLINLHSKSLNPTMNRLLNQLLNANWISLLHDMRSELMSYGAIIFMPLLRAIGDNIALQDVIQF